MFSIVLRGLRGLTQKQEFSRHFKPIPSHRKPYFATFGQISSKFNVAFGSYVQKCWFLPFLATNPPPNPGLRIFMRKTKTSLFLFHCYTTLCQKSERSNARFSRKSVTDGRTNGRTNGRRWINRSHFCLRQWTNNQVISLK